MRAANIFAASGPKGREGGVLKKLRRRLVAIIMLLVGGIMIALIAFSSANAQESFTELVNRSLERQGQAAELSVTNHGAPIDPEDLPHIFDRFYRSDKARARETGGFGLGLAIAKGIVESHGGKISVTSSLEAGTRFVVRLPLMGRS